MKYFVDIPVQWWALNVPVYVNITLLISDIWYMNIKMESCIDNTVYPKNSHSNIVIYQQSRSRSLKFVIALSEDYVSEWEAWCIWQQLKSSILKQV